jgi:hypothetical protein
MLEHGKRLVHADDGGPAHAAREPLHFHLDIPDRDGFRGYAGRQVMMPARILVAFRSEHRQHAVDVLEVLVRVPAAAHAFDVEFEGLVGQSFSVENGHGFQIYDLRFWIYD